MVDRHTTGLVQRDERLFQELDVLFFQWDGEAVDDTAKDLQ